MMSSFNAAFSGGVIYISLLLEMIYAFQHAALLGIGEAVITTTLQKWTGVLLIIIISFPQQIIGICKDRRGSYSAFGFQRVNMR